MKPMPLLSSLNLFARREFKLLWSNQENIIQPLFFFLITVSLFPFSLGQDTSLLQSIMPSVSWVAIVLATMMSLGNMFRADYEDGSLEQWLIGNRSLTIIALAKSSVYWLCNGLFLSLLACLVCLISNVPFEQIKVLFISLILGTISLQLIGGIGAALTVTIQRSGLLIAVVILPLFIPILIFGAGAVTRSVAGETVAGALYVLATLAVLAITFAPFAMSFALRHTID
jgi:heme exporter protein B